MQSLCVFMRCVCAIDKTRRLQFSRSKNKLIEHIHLLYRVDAIPGRESQLYVRVYHQGRRHAQSPRLVKSRHKSRFVNTLFRPANFAEQLHKCEKFQDYAKPRTRPRPH